MRCGEVWRLPASVSVPQSSPASTPPGQRLPTPLHLLSGRRQPCDGQRGQPGCVKDGFALRQADYRAGLAPHPPLPRSCRYNYACLIKSIRIRNPDPTNQHDVASGSKGGDIILWDTSKRTPHFPTMIKGRGPGGSIQSLKFDTHHPDRVFTASIDGRVSRLDLAQPSHRGCGYIDLGT